MSSVFQNQRHRDQPPHKSQLFSNYFEKLFDNSALIPYNTSRVIAR